MSGTDEPVRPALRIVRGTPSEQEIAALVAVLAAGTGMTEDDQPPPRSQWAAPEHLTRRVVTPSGWWASALPR